MQQLPPFPDDNPGNEPAQPAQPGQPSTAPSEAPPVGPDTDNPAQPSEAPSETPPLSPDVDQPAPGAEPNPTPVSPIGAGIVAPPD